MEPPRRSRTGVSTERHRDDRLSRDGWHEQPSRQRASGRGAHAFAPPERRCPGAGQADKLVSPSIQEPRADLVHRGIRQRRAHPGHPGAGGHRRSLRDADHPGDAERIPGRQDRRSRRGGGSRPSRGTARAGQGRRILSSRRSETHLGAHEPGAQDEVVQVRHRHTAGPGVRSRARLRVLHDEGARQGGTAER